MKKLFLLAVCFSVTVVFIAIKAQNCKPDYSKIDKIDKKKIEAWSCELFESSFGSELINTSDINITFAIGSMDNSGFVQLQLQKREESLENKLTESELKAVKGDEFFFGMKDGEPLKFTATEVSNETKKNNISGKWITTVRLLSEVKNEDLPALKAALTDRIIDALRIKLENGKVVEQSVKGKKGEKMRGKAICFFNSRQDLGSSKSEKITLDTKNKSQDKENKNVKTTPTQNNKSLPGKTNDVSTVRSEVPENNAQFEGVWKSETRKKVTLTIIKINSGNYEVKQILKVGPLKKNVSPCPTFAFVNSELICRQFKIIYLPEKNSIYYDGDEYKKE